MESAAAIERTPGRDYSLRQVHDTDGGAEQELVMYLERDQLVIDKSQPVPRAALTRRADAGLWALRGFAGVLSTMVLYTFIAQLG